MNVTFLLLGCLLSPGQQASSPALSSGGEWLAMPRLARAQEMIYRGVYREESQGPQVQYHRLYQVESRVFVLETPPCGAEIAVLTILKNRDRKAPVPRISSDQTPSSVRLERLQVDLQGKVTREGARLLLPLEGAPTLEWGMFADIPRGRLTLDQSWDVLEEGRGAFIWRAVQRESVAGNSCIKLVGVQQSDDWDRPVGNHTAWRRTDTVWLSTTLGYACRVERRIERRDPAYKTPAQWSLLRYELESTLQYPGPSYELRRQDIKQALDLRDAIKPLLLQPAHCGPQLAALAKRITAYLDNRPETPYREALLQIRSQAEAAEHGEAQPVQAENEADRVPATASLGAVAPDFMTTEFGTHSSAHLRRGKGAPILLVFFNPASPLTPDVLAFAEQIHQRFGRRMTVLGMAMGDDGKKVLAHQASLHLSFPLLSGTSLRSSYAVEETPRMVLLDASQVVRGAYTGWGSETPSEVISEIKRWLAPAVSLPAAMPQR